MLRQVIVATLGHVDHGKTTLLDAIRKTSVAQRETGFITQSIGASILPQSVLKAACGPLLAKLGVKLSVPGLLLVDTPGHEVFTNLRKRGGSIADIAMLVIDVTKGIESQTVEALEILREYKTPFVIALNKIDALDGWVSKQNSCITDSLKIQRTDVIERLEEKTYALIGELYKLGFSAERFDRVSDFTKQIVIVPVSAKTSEGLPELLLFVSGLAQKFLEKTLQTSVEEQGKGSILEVREEKGLGDTLDVILYAGSLRVGDKIAFSTLAGPVVVAVKALLEPKPLDEMRDPREKFKSVNAVTAATGVKIACEHASEAIPGSSLFEVRNVEDEKNAFGELKRELGEIVFETSAKGVILRADSLGSIEAITKLFKTSEIPIHSTAIGSPSRRDVMQAQAMRELDPFLGVIIAFNVPIPPEVELEANTVGVKVFKEKIIYNLIDGYKNWVSEEKERERKQAFQKLVLPAKITVLEGCCFRYSGPCIIGVEVLEGRIRAGYPLMNEQGQTVGHIKAIQREKESVEEAKKGEQVAISLPEPSFDRQVCFKQTLYSSPSKEDVAVLEAKYLQALTDGERELLALIKKIKGYALF